MLRGLGPAFQSLFLKKARALLNVAVNAIVGNGEEILFWTDRWLDGHTMAEIAPNLLKAVQKRTAKRRTVAQALHNRSWVQDIKGACTVEVFLDYLLIWDLVDGFICNRGFQIVLVGS
jgi:hypothetical protein